LYTKETIRPFIIQCMVTGLSEKHSLDNLSDNGFKISRQHFYRLKREIKRSRFDRLNLIAKSQFVDQHLERIDQLETINREYWSLYRKESNTFKKAIILEKITELQTYISPYYDASRYILEKSVKQNENNKAISNV
jgi:hypothetical protein